MKQIAIAIKEPNKPIQMVNTTGELEDLQKIVGGYLEYIPFENGMLLWCNEEGKLLDLQPNFGYHNDIIVGTVFFSRDNRKCEIASLKVDDIVYLRRMFG